MTNDGIFPYACLSSVFLTGEAFQSFAFKRTWVVLIVEF